MFTDAKIIFDENSISKKMNYVKTNEDVLAATGERLIILPGPMYFLQSFEENKNKT
jgi:hypothetical protein